MTQEFELVFEELQFAFLRHHVVLFQLVQDFSEVEVELFNGSAANNAVVHEDPHLWNVFEHALHVPLENARCIFQSHG